MKITDHEFYASARRMILLALCLILAAGMGFAQGQSRLTGTVTDSSNAVIPGAEVTVMNTATGVSNTTQTNATGTYNFPFLQPGGYEITVTSAGFKSYTQSGLVLDTGYVRTLNIQLELGEVTETIEVTGSAPLLESENSTIGQLIEQSNVINMPLESRRSASLVRLMGGVTFRDENGAEQAPRFSMFGGRPYNQMWQLDGGVAQNMTMGVQMLSINPPAESLQEFKIESSNYSAEFGRAGGGLIQMTTKSGTNEYHGNGYWFLRNDKLDARTFFAADKAKLRYNIFGASLGGPIKKDKAFFFFNYEGARRRDGETVNNRTLPRVAERQGDFSARSDSILDPMTGDPFPGNIIPSSRIDPLSAKFLALLPNPNRATDLTRASSSNFNANRVVGLTQNFVTTRVDFNISQNDRVYGKYSWVEAPQSLGAFYPTPEIDPSAGPRENVNHHLVVSWFHNYSPTLIQEVRWGYMRRLHVNRGAGTGSGLNSQLGVGGVNPDALARVTIQGYTQIGQNNHERIQVPIRNNQFIYNITKVLGNHTIKAGAELRMSMNKDDANASTGGRFNFTRRATNDGLATMLLGWTTDGNLFDTDILTTRSDFWGAYIQDDWKITPNFTLNLGMRWEVDQPRWERENNRQSGFAFDPINPVSGTPGIVTFSGRDGLSKYAHDWDTNNFAPRFGFAYRFREKTVIRGGYGIQYMGAYKSAVPNCCQLGFSENFSFTSPDGGFTPAFTFQDGLPAPPERPPLDSGFGAVPVGQNTTTAADFFQRDHPTGYMQQWNLTVQQDLGFNSVLEVAYMANVGHKLGGNDVSYNMIPLVNGMGPASQSQTLRPFPQFSNVTMKSPSWGNSAYHGLNVKWEKRYSNGLNFLANYTFAKYLDDVEGNAEAGDTPSNGYTHIDRRNLDRALSGSHLANRFIASTVYDLPIGRGRKFNLDSGVLNAIIGEWGLGAVLELRDGFAYGVIEQTNRTNAFAHSNRPFINGDHVLPTDRPRSVALEEWFNTSAFTNQAGDPDANMAAGVFGDATRMYCCGPGLAMLDVSVHKWFNLTERFRLQFRSDFLNLPNRPHFNLPNRSRQNSNFGRINSTLRGSNPRRIQFSLKLQF